MFNAISKAEYSARLGIGSMGFMLSSLRRLLPFRVPVAMGSRLIRGHGPLGVGMGPRARRPPVWNSGVVCLQSIDVQKSTTMLFSDIELIHREVRDLMAVTSSRIK